MDYTTLGLVVLTAVLTWGFLKYLLPKIKLEIDIRNMVKSIKDIAKIIADDEVDKTIDDIYTIFSSAYELAEMTSENGIVNYDMILDFVYENFSVIEIRISDETKELLDIVVELICSIVYNDNK